MPPRRELYAYHRNGRDALDFLLLPRLSEQAALSVVFISRLRRCSQQSLEAPQKNCRSNSIGLLRPKTQQFSFIYFNLVPCIISRCTKFHFRVIVVQCFSHVLKFIYNAFYFVKLFYFGEVTCGFKCIFMRSLARAMNCFAKIHEWYKLVLERIDSMVDTKSSTFVPVSCHKAFHV